jgi:hypothetical protein
MTCDTYLSMLETLPVSELAFGDAADHAASCRDCDRVTRVVAERERNMLLAYGTISPPVPTGLVAAHALELSRRRRIAFYYRFALVIAAVVSVLGFLMVGRVRPTMARVGTSFIGLQCLSGEQALDILRPSVSPEVAISARGSSSVVRIVASRAEAARIRAILRLYDNSAMSPCGGAALGAAAAAPARAIHR